ncbi:AzlD domain-containing protein [Halomonas sp. V046]|uniref:AzlD domain-containing protein n=1 Tax=Halomonas sp. V046 TaxID=3459611 RepID=UPI004043AAF3
MPSPEQSLVAIVAMATIAYGARVVGFLLMARMPIGPQARRFLDAMASSVLVAVIVPMVVFGDGATRLATVVATAVALWLKLPLAAIAAGMLAAASWRWLAGG